MQMNICYPLQVKVLLVFYTHCFQVILPMFFQKSRKLCLQRCNISVWVQFYICVHKILPCPLIVSTDKLTNTATVHRHDKMRLQVCFTITLIKDTGYLKQTGLISVSNIDLFPQRMTVSK